MSRARRRVLALAGVLVAVGAFPSAAGAHGPVAPIASSFLAKVSRVPAGVDAKVVDGDQRMWLRVLPSETVAVLDYRGAPYLRFSAFGVEVNQNSEMYYLNQTPVAETPPSGLTRTTRPSWQRVSGGHDYSWHDGRLHALASVAVSPGVAYVGKWNIPLLVDGRLRSISGGLWHADDPSLVWFWPIVVLLLCVMAAWRVRRPALDRLVAGGVAIGALVAIAVAGVGRYLHGRPTVSMFQLIELGIILAFVGWGLFRVLWQRARPGYFFYFVIALVALWEGVLLIPTLLNGIVLIAVPAFVARAATVLCLGCGLGLLLLGFRSPSTQRSCRRAESRQLRLTVMMIASATAWSRQAERASSRLGVPAGVLLSGALLLGGCGSTGRPALGSGLPPALVAQARPIGRSASFHPPTTGPVTGRCQHQLGARFGVHVELFAANRVVLIAGGIGTRPPRGFSAGRISRARCYGDLVTLEPTGVVLVRPGARLVLSDLFRAWGHPLSRSRLASFPAAPGPRVAVFVNARRWHASPGSVPLRRHSEIVLEVGPHVPPHASYTFPPGT